MSATSEQSFDLMECRPEGGCHNEAVWYVGDCHEDGDRTECCREHVREAVDAKCVFFPHRIVALDGNPFFYVQPLPWASFGKQWWCYRSEEMYAECDDPSVGVEAVRGPWGLWTATDGARRCWGRTPGQAIERVLTEALV